ncbi:MAG: apolipoprotein N-acyltransferase, partial [Bryobacteraceae bacterium]
MSKPFDARASFALSVLTAALLILLYPDFKFAWLAPIALTPLLIVLAREPRPVRRFLLGYVAGVIYWFGVCYWIQFVLEVHGGLGRWGGWGTFLLFCVLKALHFGLFSLLAAILMRHWYAIPAIAALWTSIERTHADLGFTWLLLGNAGIDMPLPMRLAPIVGVYGLSFVFAMISVAVALIILRRPRKQLLWLTPLVLLFALPALPAPEPTTATATLVQPAVPEEYDWTPENTAQAENLLANLTYGAALASKPQLLIWPEVPGPFYWYADPGLRQRAADLTHLTGAYFLMGTVAEDAGG